jgi:hypothetical protein
MNIFSYYFFDFIDWSSLNLFLFSLFYLDFFFFLLLSDDFSFIDLPLLNGVLTDDFDSLSCSEMIIYYDPLNTCSATALGSLKVNASYPSSKFVVTYYLIN